MRENRTPGLRWRGLETGPGRPYTGTKLETADTAKGSLPVPRQSSTLLDAPVLADPDAPGQSVLEDGVHVPAGTCQRLACDASRVGSRPPRPNQLILTAMSA